MKAHFLIHGVNLNITSSNRSFVNFAKEYLRGFEVTHVGESDITVSVAMRPGFSLRTQYESYAPHVLGENVGWDAKNNTLYLHHKELEARLTLTAPWYAEVSFQRNLFRHVANQIFFGGGRKENHYNRIVLRMIVQQLVFMQLAQRWNITALSAAAFKVGSKAYIVAGLPGSGKTTLVSALKEKLGAETVAENFVLTDGERLFPFPEGNCTDVLAAPIGGVYILTHGEQFSSYQMPRQEAYYTLRAINNGTAELPEHSALTSLMLVDPTRWQFLFDADNETLKKLCERHSCTRLVTDNGLEKTLEHFTSL